MGARTAVLVSGTGSNLQALIDARQDIGPAELSLVVSNLSDAPALGRASHAGIETRILSHRDFAKRSAFDGALRAMLQDHDIEWVVLAGFMRILGPNFLKGFENRVINTHPSLLPSFPGMHAAKQAIDYGARVSGCTIHLVDDGVDSGVILAQSTVAILKNDDAAALQKKIQSEEHRLLPRVLKHISAGDLQVSGRRAHWARSIEL